MGAACDPDNKLTTFEVSENSLPQLRKLYLESASSRAWLMHRQSAERGCREAHHRSALRQIAHLPLALQ